MSDLNQIILTGRLGQDPETKTVNETTVTNFSMASNEVWKGKDGNKQEKTEWSKCTAWGKLGENIQKFFSKGDQILILGKKQTRSWEDKEGIKRYTTDVIVSDWFFFGNTKKSEGESSGNGGSPGDGPPPDFGGESNDIPF